ncbi:ABC transporter ATP-binding protein [Micrococcus sp.]|uniref:ABC transporter ATP-binding protein n=1 Tax=Micrococcus sp. TaxID=1271 RepID=UPI002A90CE83|nr:ABC transporter ATP-binding protein [Micrococcus sp.]MDY6055005.1 ABC transporter ATP-binding protein [Micrococcus sp.]
MSDPAIHVQDVSLRFSSGSEAVTALDGVSVAFGHGEFVAVMGASGSGKTSMLHVIAGLEVPDSGVVRVADADLAGLGANARADVRLHEIGLVFQDDNLLPMLTAQENVALPLRARGWTAAQAAEEADAWLGRVGLAGMEGRRPVELSGGQRQRVGIARAVAGGRRILLADEPTGALDSVTTREILSLLRALADDGVCVVVVTHDDVVRDYADHVWTMSDGRLSGGTDTSASALTTGSHA